MDYSDGSHILTAYQSNAVLNATTGPDTIYISTSGASAGWVVTINFPALFGHDTVYGFDARAIASDASHPADTVVLPATEFANFNAFYQDSVYSSSVNGVVATAAANGDSLTLHGMTMSSLLAAQADFRFV